MDQKQTEFRYELIDGNTALDVLISFYCEILFFNPENPILVNRAKITGTMYTGSSPKKINGIYFLSEDDGEWHCNYLASMNSDVPLIWESENSSLLGESGSIQDHLAVVIARYWNVEIKTYCEKYSLDRHLRSCEFAVESSKQELKRQETKYSAINDLLKKGIYANLR